MNKIKRISEVSPSHKKMSNAIKVGSRGKTITRMSKNADGHIEADSYCAV